MQNHYEWTIECNYYRRRIRGLSAAQALKSAPVNVTVIDRRNYHLFQPLLYQVAPVRSHFLTAQDAA